jgi:hypothetical protein
MRALLSHHIQSSTPDILKTYYMHILGTLGIFPLKLLVTFPYHSAIVQAERQTPKRSKNKPEYFSMKQTI